MSVPQADPRSLLPLHPLEVRILLVLAERDTHGYRIVKEIESREQSLPRIYPGNLYRRVRDLLTKGLVADAEAPDSPEVDSRRRYFRITELGKAVLRAEVTRMEGLLREAKRVSLFSLV